MKTIRWIAMGCFSFVLSLAAPAFSQAQEQGVGNFLNGYWSLSPAGTTGLVLLNPTGKDRDAVVLFYDDDERFLTCEVRRLSPHDMEGVRFPLLFRDFCAAFPDTCGGLLIAEVGGHVEIRSEPLDNSGTPGINGYLRQMGRGLGSGSAPLFIMDPKLFQIESKDLPRIMKCACPMLKTLSSPLYPVFCPG